MYTFMESMIPWLFSSYTVTIWPSYIALATQKYQQYYN